MKYVTTQSITIPAGTEFFPDSTHGEGGLVAREQINNLLTTIHLGRANAFELGIIAMRPDTPHLRAVDK